MGERKAIWERELKTYEGSTGLLECRCDGHTCPVGGQTPQSLLLVTPLTRFARTVIFKALTEERPLIVTGGVGTGKTETIKDTIISSLGQTVVSADAEAFLEVENTADHMRNLCKSASSTW